MKVSYKWLKDFVDLSDVDPYELADRLTNSGLEVEETYPVASGTNLVIGKILECKDHPDSDHLKVTKVDIGDEVLDIVCGAPNCREGLKVIVAKVGAKLLGGEIKAGKIRGVVSDSIIRILRERDYIKVVGRKDVQGHPCLYGTTRKFLYTFKLDSISALPKLSEIDRQRFEKEEDEN